MEALLADVAGIGPFFAVAAGPAPPGGAWVPVRDLGAGDVLADRIGAVQVALGTDRRVAASTAFQGLAAQLAAPLYAAVVLHGVLPAPTGPGAGLADALHWRPGGAGPWLWWAGPGRVVPCPDAALAGVLDALLAPLVAAVRARASVGEQVLRGNAASAVGSARRLVAAARPGSAARATAVAGRLLATPPWATTATLRPAEPPDLAWTFRRRSCCLYYRVPGGDLCADCVLQDRPRGAASRRVPPGGRDRPTAARLDSAGSVAPPSPAP